MHGQSVNWWIMIYSQFTEYQSITLSKAVEILSNPIFLRVLRIEIMTVQDILRSIPSPGVALKNLQSVKGVSRSSRSSLKPQTPPPDMFMQDNEIEIKQPK